MFKTDEKVYFERWKIPVLIDERPVPKRSSISRESGEGVDRLQQEMDVERKRIRDEARLQVQQRILVILEVWLYLHQRCVLNTSFMISFKISVRV